MPKCLLRIWAGQDSSGTLLATFDASNPVPVIPYTTRRMGQKFYVEFTATDPAVRFMATWVCSDGKSPTVLATSTTARTSQAVTATAIGQTE